MIALHGGAVHAANSFDAFVRAGVVTDNIAQANKMIAVILLGVGGHGVERFEVGVDVTEDGEAHDRSAAILGD